MRVLICRAWMALVAALMVGWMPVLWLCKRAMDVSQVLGHWADVAEIEWLLALACQRTRRKP